MHGLDTNNNRKSGTAQILKTVLGLTIIGSVAVVHADGIIGEEPALGAPEARITQGEVESGHLKLHDLRVAGLKVFTTQFNQYDGYGDGPVNPLDKTVPGGRPTLQDNGTFLRVNGLDSQTCLECHSIISTQTTPFTMGVGGAGGLNNSAMFFTRAIDVEDAANQGFAGFDGRVINPPAVFGTGGVQQVGKEMTTRLQKLMQRATNNPGQVVQLTAKGVNFGTLIADSAGNVDTSSVEGVADDLVIRPFGRKGEFSSVRGFDQGAMMFHLGMQPVEIVGEGIDEDGDGVVNEIQIGEMSVLEIFLTTQETPRQTGMNRKARAGFRQFKTIGCADCHRPALTSESRKLSYSFPEVENDPSANVFFEVDLHKGPMKFKRSRRGGIRVAMFSDLKRHDMGDGLKEAFHGGDDKFNREFITAKLWGVADTSPYLHDGRALTINTAILAHGGAAQAARDTYDGLANDKKNEVLAFLNTLRNPVNPNKDVLD